MSEKSSNSFGVRSLIEWGGWAVWLFLAIFLFQNAVASGQELEPRAATIFWVTLVVWLLAGAVVWFIRSNRR
ncbi:MAG: hypothetical protein R2873_24400 [Caldilineaceae bacterium]|nr:hypothetical protein [Caldilineaceae bacterium]